MQSGPPVHESGAAILLHGSAAIYEVRAVARPDTVLKLLNFFAQRGLTPAVVRAVTIGDMLHVTIHQHGLADHDADVIAAKMRSLVVVASVALEQCAEPRSKAA